jgi:HTH-type transcriptional regulator/antitoxin HigA
MGVRTSSRTQPDSYFKLVKRFPLVHIEDEDHAKAAQEVIDQLLRQDLDAGEQAYLDVLTDLFEAYETKHVPIPDASEADVLRELMNSNKINLQTLTKQVGIAPAALTAVLNGTRSLTRDQAVKLAKFFHVSPAAFEPV